MARSEAARGPVLGMCLLLGACTEPNPYLPVADGSSGSTGAGTGATTLVATDGSTTTGSGTEAGGSSTGEPTCADRGMTCVAAAPEGFSGPFAWLERPADAPMDCPAPFPRQLVEAFSELSAPAAACDCDCGPLTNAECGAASVTRHSGVACAGAAQATLALDGVCNPIGGVGWAANTSFFFHAPQVTGGGCLPLPTVDKGPAAFLTRHLACAGPLDPEGCEAGRLCAAPPDDPFHARMCVWQEGDVACPEASDYAQRTLLYRDIEDQRGCEQCTCAAPSGACEGTSAVLSTAYDCSVLTAAVAPDDCVGGLGGPSIQSVHYTEGTPPSACEPAVVVPTGDAAGTDPITFCCMR